MIQQVFLFPNVSGSNFYLVFKSFLFPTFVCMILILNKTRFPLVDTFCNVVKHIFSTKIIKDDSIILYLMQLGVVFTLLNHRINSSTAPVFRSYYAN